MTRSQLSTQACNKLSMTEDEDLAAAGGFLTNRNEMLWQSQLWKDSLVEYVQTLSGTYAITSNYLPTDGIVLVNPIVQRVVAVRTELNALNVQRPEIFYRRDFDTFGQQGLVVDFVLLSPSIWQFDSSVLALPVLLNTAANDQGLIVNTDVLDVDSINVRRLAITASTTQVALATTSRLDSLSKIKSNSNITLSVGATTFVTMLAADNNVAKMQRIKLVQVPPTSRYPVTLRILGKRICPTFSNDLDEPSINGSDNLLLALCQYDLLQRSRQYGKAAALMTTEIPQLYKQLVDLEVVQQAFSSRILPSQGYGDNDWFANDGMSALTF